MTVRSEEEAKSMRRDSALPVVGVLAMLTLLPALGDQSPDVPRHVDRAVRLLLAPDSSDEQCKDGLVSLLDAIIGAAPAARVGGEWPTTIAAARSRAARGELGETAALLNDSYRALHGTPFKMPVSVRSIQDARDYIRGQLSSVRGLLDQGRPDEAVRRMLEAAVMIVTPTVR
jgi:hypothetical protein